MIRDIENGARAPRIDANAYIDQAAQVIGEVTIGPESSVWPFALVRGDQSWVRIGRRSNVQDHAVVHVAPGVPCVIGDNVTIGHRAVVHACTVMNNCRIGIGSILLDGVVVEEGAQVGAGALVPPGKVVKAGWLVMGVPAKPVRQMSQAEFDDIMRNAQEYVDLWQSNFGRRTSARPASNEAP
jgi:carbonic anhydrase/acetyltransferase-like protein (isoleucine patch superfamily)